MRLFLREKILELEKNSKSNDFVKNALTLISGAVISQSLNVAFSPVLSRIYSVKDFGINALYISILGMISAISTLRFDSAIPVSNEEDASGLFRLSCITSAFFSVLSFFVLATIQYSGKIIFDVSFPFIMSIMLSITVLVQSFVSAFSFWANREKLYKILMWYPIINTGVAIITNLLLGLVKFTEYGLIVGNLLGLITSLIYLFFYSKPLLEFKHNYRNLFRKYDKFPKYESPALLLNNASTQVPVLLFSLFFGGNVVGWYAMGYRILQMPLALVGNSIAQVYYKRIAEKASNNESIAQLTKEIIQKLLILIFIPMTLLIGFGDKVFILFFGVDWAEAGVFSGVLAPWMSMVLITSPLASVVVVFNKQKQNMYMNLLITSLRILIIILGGIYFKNYMTTIILFGIVSFILLYVRGMYISQLAGIRTREYIRFTTIYFVLLIVPALLLRLVLTPGES